MSKKKGRIISLNHAAVHVKNIHEVNKFYHEVMGLPQDHYAPKPDSYTIFTQGLEIQSRGPELGKEGYMFTHLGFEVENIEAVVEELESKGVKFRPFADGKKVREVRRIEEPLAVKIAFYNDPVAGIPGELVEWRKLSEKEWKEWKD